MYRSYYYFDPTYILVIIGAILCLAASALVKSTYKKYSAIRSRSGMSGAEAASRILRYAGINDVSINHVPGDLTDHYDPKNKVLNLSDTVYDSLSVAAIGVAAHECGHAIQHQKGYVPLKIRSALVPAANIGSKIGIPLVIVGLVLGLNATLVQVGIWIFAIAVLFQIVTLPVEFNASHRALVVLNDGGIMGDEEIDYCKRVLGAAALTYVAAAASSVLQLLRLVLLSKSNSRNRD